jgi:hypothetical protein
MEANRVALQSRAFLLPYVYNGHRKRSVLQMKMAADRVISSGAAFDTGVGLIRPMYYHYPELNQAYAMDNNGNNVQYMFGPSILFAPVVTAGNTSQVGMGPGLANKVTWYVMFYVVACAYMNEDCCVD